jgi:hypothetical protein
MIFLVAYEISIVDRYSALIIIFFQRISLLEKSYDSNKDK